VRPPSLRGITRAGTHTATRNPSARAGRTPSGFHHRAMSRGIGRRGPRSRTGDSAGPACRRRDGQAGTHHLAPGRHRCPTRCGTAVAPARSRNHLIPRRIECVVGSQLRGPRRGHTLDLSGVADHAVRVGVDIQRAQHVGAAIVLLILSLPPAGHDIVYGIVVSYDGYFMVRSPRVLHNNRGLSAPAHTRRDPAGPAVQRETGTG
jgi:hypothetical protein